MDATLNGMGTRRRQTGFAYILLLVSIAVIGIVASSSLSVGALVSRRDAEQNLLTVGKEFEQSLRGYAGASAAGINAPNARGPRTLEELLKDPRAPAVKRHLRQIYADPLTGKAEWGLVKDPAGFIVGVYSLSEGKPIKRTEFDGSQAHFEAATSYSEWIFGLPAARQRVIGTLVPTRN